MRSKRAMLAVVFLLAAVAAASAEVALDEVVQAGRFVLYRDHADAHKYYYVPDAPRLATKRDGTPEFSFIKYTKTDGATKGGIIHFLVTWGMTEGELSSAESALRLKDPEAKIAGPVPFKEGVFKVVSATAGEGGIFSRRIVGEGKAPIMPGQKAAVSIALSEEGASLLWESFKNPTSDISVLFDLKFAGVTPAFQAKLKVNWDKVYTQHDIKLHAEGTIKVVKIEADVRAILEELRQKGAIQLEVVGENENMQKMLDVVYTHLLALMCEKVPMGPGEATSPPAKKRPVPEVIANWPDVAPAWSMGVLAEVVRSSDERLRGGPFLDQEQVQSAQQEDCPPDARKQANQLETRAKAFLAAHQFREAVQAFEKAYSVCPDPQLLFFLGSIWDENLKSYRRAKENYDAFMLKTGSLGRYPEFRDKVHQRLQIFEKANEMLAEGLAIQQDADTLDGQGQKTQAVTRYNEAVAVYRRGLDIYNAAAFMLNIAGCYFCIGDIMSDREYLGKALEAFRELSSFYTQYPESSDDVDGRLEYVNKKVLEINNKLQSLPADRPAIPAGAVDAGTKPPTGQAAATGQAQQQTTAQQGTKPPDTTGGTKPPSGQAPAAKPGAKPDAKNAPEIKPIVSVQIGYSFKRTKMSGNYEVDLRKRLREDRDIVMSGNIGGIYQRYGEDKRFFSVVSLDDPTFQERSVEVILDGQDASDFKDYINSVSVLFRKQRFSGAPMTGEVKFVDQQFAQSGNRLSFKYGRLNEASTEWLDYEYKPKWSFYGGVEWEGEWTKTSDSVLTLSPPVRRRTLEISVDEDNILKNSIKALAIQIKHQIYGKDILKEVVINYDKGDPLQADYTYMHEDGNLGYSYKVVWLLLDGREVHTDWTTKESPFIYAVYAKK